MSYEQKEHERRMARLHEQLGAIQRDQRATDRIRAEQARQAVWRAQIDAAMQQNAAADAAQDARRRAYRSVLGSCRHIDPQTGR